MRGERSWGTSLHSPPTGSHARASESQRTPTEAKHPGLARPGKTQGGCSSLPRRAWVQDGEVGAHVTCARRDCNKCPGAGASSGRAGSRALHRGCTEQ